MSGIAGKLGQKSGIISPSFDVPFGHAADQDYYFGSAGATSGNRDNHNTLLIVSNTNNGNTGFSDFSDRNHTVTRDSTPNHNNGGAGKCGASTAIEFNGDGGLYIADDASSYNFSTNIDFTIDMWYRWDSSDAAVYPAMFTNRQPNWSNGGVVLTIDRGNQRHDLARYPATICSTSTSINGGSTSGLGDWHHLAAGRKGTKFYIFFDGKLEGTSTTSYTMDFNSNGTAVGGLNWDGANSEFKGWMQNIRVSRGICRWTENFTPPENLY